MGALLRSHLPQPAHLGPVVTHPPGAVVGAIPNRAGGTGSPTKETTSMALHTVNVIDPLPEDKRKKLNVRVMVVQADSEAEAVQRVADECASSAHYAKCRIQHRADHGRDAVLTWAYQTWERSDSPDAPIAEALARPVVLAERKLRDMLDILPDSKTGDAVVDAARALLATLNDMRNANEPT